MTGIFIGKRNCAILNRSHVQAEDHVLLGAKVFRIDFCKTAPVFNSVCIQLQYCSKILHNNQEATIGIKQVGVLPKCRESLKSYRRELTAWKLLCS
jgi:hypothetical protein